MAMMIRKCPTWCRRLHLVMLSKWWITGKFGLRKEILFSNGAFKRKTALVENLRCFWVISFELKISFATLKKPYSLCWKKLDSLLSVFTLIYTIYRLRTSYPPIDWMIEWLILFGELILNTVGFLWLNITLKGIWAQFLSFSWMIIQISSKSRGSLLEEKFLVILQPPMKSFVWK